MSELKPPLIETRWEEAGFIEFINEDVPTIVRDLDGPAAILIDVNTRKVVGYRVYDPSKARATTAVSVDDAADALWEHLLPLMQAGAPDVYQRKKDALSAIRSALVGGE